MTGLIFGALACLGAGPNLAIIPEPAHLKADPTGSIAIPNGASVSAPREWRRFGREIEGAFGAVAPRGKAFFVLRKRPTLKDEGYRLTIGTEGVRIEAKSDAGAFYALQTLSQLKQPGLDRLPCVQIEDEPRFAWRGLMVDVARHYWKPTDLRRFVDAMAKYKFNRLHLHLTDDQGWRIELPGWPGLRGVAGGSYSESELRSLASYAAKRFVEIVPEVESPGHSQALVAAYPELACQPPEGLRPMTTPGVSKELVCPAKPKVFAFYRDLFAMLGRAFPGKAIHVGGDEAPTDRWQACPDCIALRAREGLRSPEAEMSWFFRRLATLMPPGRRPLVWYEESIADYPPGTVAYTWRLGRTPSVLDAAFRRGMPVICAPGEHCYLDYPQVKDGLPNSGWMPTTTLEQAYALDPGYGLPADRQKLILGAEGVLWGEYVSDLGRAFYMVYPRAFALAEACWSPLSVRDWQKFRQKAIVHRDRWKAEGVEIGPIP